MTMFRHPITGAVQSASNPAVVRFLESRGYQPADPQAAADLKGADLDAALEQAELPKTGTADEKRQRLADHAAALAAGDTPAADAT